VLGAIAGTVPASGSVTVGGREVLGMPVESRRVGYLFQEYLLFPHLTVLENVAFGPRAQGVPRSVARDRSLEWLARLGIPDLADRRPSQLSGGQAQRVALARALAGEPEVLLLDEPLAALDVEVRDDVRTELARHLADWGGVAIVVTHDVADVRALASDVIVLEGGSATQRGTVDELARHPATPYITRLLGAGSATQ
jgi:ABC-type sulfate/molybdate transport systems ATPase subunit